MGAPWILQCSQPGSSKISSGASGRNAWKRKQLPGKVRKFRRTLCHKACTEYKQDVYQTTGNCLCTNSPLSRPRPQNWLCCSNVLADIFRTILSSIVSMIISQMIIRMFIISCISFGMRSTWEVSFPIPYVATFPRNNIDEDLMFN